MTFFCDLLQDQKGNPTPEHEWPPDSFWKILYRLQDEQGPETSSESEDEQGPGTSSESEDQQGPVDQNQILSVAVTIDQQKTALKTEQKDDQQTGTEEIVM